MLNSPVGALYDVIDLLTMTFEAVDIREQHGPDIFVRRKWLFQRRLILLKVRAMSAPSAEPPAVWSWTALALNAVQRCCHVDKLRVPCLYLPM